MQSTAVDLLINCRWIIPIVPENTVLENCSLAVNGGRIVSILPSSEAAAHFNADTVLDLDHHILMPGLINAHTHAAMNLLRGYADNLPLKIWLEEYIWPAEKRWISEAFVRDGTRLAMAEMIKSGTTCFSDMYFFAEEITREVRTSGMRCQVACTVLDFPTAGGKDADEYIHRALEVRDNCKGQDLIKVAFGPHAPYTVSDQVMQKIATYANELDMAIQIHTQETAGEVSEFLSAQGCRPLEKLQQLGILLPQTQCVHMTQVDQIDIQLLRDNNCHVIHCPESNLKLASGICPVVHLQDSGINVAIGTDSAASNNDLDLFGELKTAALLASNTAGNPAAFDAHAALRMATINGAKALGWQEEIGSLEHGKSADMIAIEIDSICQTPLYNPASQLLYTNSGTQVSHSWVAGKPLMQDKKLLTLNEQGLLETALQWQTRIHG